MIFRYSDRILLELRLCLKKEITWTCGFIFIVMNSRTFSTNTHMEISHITGVTYVRNFMQ